MQFSGGLVVCKNYCCTFLEGRRKTPFGQNLDLAVVSNPLMLAAIMGHPFIDIYALTDDRSFGIINEFFLDFNEPEQIEKEYEEIQLYNNPADLSDITWVEVGTTREAIAFGLQNPGVCYVILLHSNINLIEWTSITFTFDNKLVLGLSIREYQDEDGLISNWPFSKKIREQLSTKYNTKFTLIGLELNFPFTESEFLQLKGEYD